MPTAIDRGCPGSGVKVLDFVDFHAYEFAGSHDASNATIVYNFEPIAWNEGESHRPNCDL